MIIAKDMAVHATIMVSPSTNPVIRPAPRDFRDFLNFNNCDRRPFRYDDLMLLSVVCFCGDVIFGMENLRRGEQSFPSKSLSCSLFADVPGIGGSKVLFLFVFI